MAGRTIARIGTILPENLHIHLDPLDFWVIWGMLDRKVLGKAW